MSCEGWWRLEDLIVGKRVGAGVGCAVCLDVFGPAGRRAPFPTGQLLSLGTARLTETCSPKSTTWEGKWEGR